MENKKSGMMKRSRVGVMAMAALMMGGLSQAAPVEVKDINATSQQSKQELPKQTRETRRQILPDGTGGVYMPMLDHGRSPKEYGIYLQYNRKQKWSKKAGA